MIGKKFLINVVGAALVVAAFGMTPASAFGSGPQSPTPKQLTDLTQGGGPMGNGFVENKGQWNSKARYFTSTGTTRMWVTDSSVVYDFFQTIKPASKTTPAEFNGDVVAMEFENSSANSAAVGSQPINRRINFIMPKQTYHADSYAEADIKGIYDGVDLHLTKENNNPRFDFVVAPGHNVSSIVVNYRGAQGITKNSDGTLSLATSIGHQAIANLHAFQNVNGVKQPVDVKFDLHADGRVGFKVGSYDRTKALTIDPTYTSVIYSTLMGDNGAEFTQGFGVAVGQDSAPVMTGFTTAPDFPVTVGAYQNYVPGGDLFVTKFSQDGSHLIFSSLIGTFPSGVACGTLVQLDSANRVIIGGFAEGNYPVTAGALQTTPSTGNNFGTILSILSADGSTLVYSTYLGGGFQLQGADGFGGVSGSFGFGDVQNIGDDPREYGNLLNIALDSSDRIYIFGEGTITPTANAYQSSPPQDNTFILCLNSNASVYFATYYGGPQSGTAGGTVAPDGGMYLCGYTSGGIPATKGAFQTVARSKDGFVTKLNPVTSTTSPITVAFTTYIGGSGDDYCGGIAVNSIGEPYVWGGSGSIDFPTTTGAFGSGSDGGLFAAKFDGAGANLEYATYTGLGVNVLSWISVDPSGNLYLTGSVNTDVPFEGVPVGGPTSQAVYTPYNPKEPFIMKSPNMIIVPAFTPGDAFLEVLNPTGTGLVYGSYWGGTYDDQAEDLAIDSGGNCYMVGWTDSFVCSGPTSVEFPTTPGVFDNTYYDIPTEPTNQPAPWLFWNAAPVQKGLVPNDTVRGPYPMGFLTKFKVSGAPYVSGLDVPGVIPGGTASSGTVVLDNAPTAANPVPVEVECSNQAIIPSQTVTITGPATTGNFSFKVADVTVDTAVTLTAYHDGIYIIRGVEVVPLLQSFSVSVPTIVGGNSTTARVFLAEDIPNGSTVTLAITTTNPAVAKPTASTLVITGNAGGQNSGLINITTSGVDGPTQVTFSARIIANTLPNATQQAFAYSTTSVLTVTPASVKNVTFNPQILFGGFTSQGQVVLNGAAGPTPIVVNLTETQGTAPVKLSATTLTIPTGSNSASFGATTSTVFANVFKTIVATQQNNGATADGTIFVNPITLGSFQLITPTITGGSTAEAYVTLGTAAPTGGLTVNLSANNKALATLSSPTVTIPAGSAQTPIFFVKTPITDVPETVSLTATFGTLAVSNTLAILPETLTLTGTPGSVEGGIGNFSFNLTVPRAEQNDPLIIKLSSTAPAAITLPASVDIVPGKTTISFFGYTKVVPAKTVVTITASIPSLQGLLSATKAVTITPLPFVLNVLPQNLIGGVQNGSGTITLSTVSSSSTTVTLSSSNSAAATPSPATVTIPAGKQTGTFTIVTNQVAQQTPVILTGSDSLGVNSTSFTVLPPEVTLNSLKIANPSIYGGLSTTGTVSFTGSIPKGGLNVTLKSSNTSVAQVPASVTLEPGKTSASFTITTSSVSSDTPVTISAGYGTTQVSATMTVLAVRTGTLTLNPSSVVGGHSVTITVSVNSAAPAGGIVVQLSQSSTILSQPGGVALNGVVIPLNGSNGPFPTITIPGGKTSAMATLTTPSVSRQLGTTIIGLFAGYNQASATLLVNPAQ